MPIYEGHQSSRVHSFLNDDSETFMKFIKLSVFIDCWSHGQMFLQQVYEWTSTEHESVQGGIDA
jgi:hypothetical protein